MIMVVFDTNVLASGFVGVDREDSTPKKPPSFY